MMNLLLETSNFVLKAMNFALKMMSFAGEIDENEDNQVDFRQLREFFTSDLLLTIAGSLLRNQIQVRAVIDEFAFEIYELCIKNDEFCINNGEFQLHSDEFAYPSSAAPIAPI